MKIVKVPLVRSLDVFMVEGGKRKFVLLSALATELGREPWDLVDSFREFNSTEYVAYVPWVVAYGSDTTTVEVPVWGTEIKRGDTAATIYVDANWAWDVLRLAKKYRVWSVGGVKHYHQGWTGSPCSNGNFRCIWKDPNPLSRSGKHGFMAIFAHDADPTKLITVPDSFRSCQSYPRARFEPKRRSRVIG